MSIKIKIQLLEVIENQTTLDLSHAQVSFIKMVGTPKVKLSYKSKIYLNSGVAFKFAPNLYLLPKIKLEILQW